MFLRESNPINVLWVDYHAACSLACGSAKRRYKLYLSVDQCRLSVMPASCSPSSPFFVCTFFYVICVVHYLKAWSRVGKWSAMFSLSLPIPFHLCVLLFRQRLVLVLLLLQLSDCAVKAAVQDFFPAWFLVLTKSFTPQELYGLTARWQWERKKKKRFRTQNKNFARASHCTFHCRHFTTTTWKCLILHFIEDINRRLRNFSSLSELG